MLTHHFIDRLQRWHNTALTQLKQKNRKAWFFVVVLGYIVLEVIRTFVSDASTLLLVWGFRGLQWVLEQPMGVGGLALLLYLAVLIGSSWWQSRPRPEPAVTQPQPPALTDHDRRLVQDIRTVWIRNGVSAVSQLHAFLRDSVYRLEGREFWAELLRPIIDRLEASRVQFEAVLDPKAAAGPGTVRVAFNEMYKAYLEVMKWVAILESHNLDEGVRADQRLDIWRQNHRDMINRLHDLNADPDHNATLYVYLNWIDNPAFRKFHRNAEVSPEWLALMEESRRPAPPADE